ncbi:hypothetical protein E5288_WYG012651 [Bos mutus]|uniref:Uncharacterized protein n=1 Tax=Bos mutus TaxID=72004 RepID=A0A6B0QWI1_9CETA|nr:hypothetical protein [Bos mutus]
MYSLSLASSLADTYTRSAREAQSSSTSESKEEDPMHCPPPAQSSSFRDTRCVHLAEQETHIPSTDVGSLLCPVFIQERSSSAKSPGSSVR